MAFPVDTNNYKFIEEICMKEGETVFLKSIPLNFGHTYYVKEIAIVGYAIPLRATLTADALATDSTYQVAKGHNMTTNSWVGYSANSKQYKITAIDTSNPSYDLITLSYTLGVAIKTGDYIQQYTAFDRPIEYFLGTTLNGSFIQDYNFTTNQLVNGSVLKLQPNKIMEQGEAFFTQKSTLEFPAIISVTYLCYKVSADVNFKAKRVIYGFGDSIANPSGYVTRYNGHMWNQAKLEVNKPVSVGGKAFDGRLVVDYMDGKTSTDLVTSLRAGRKVIDNADVILFMHGVNDAYQGTTDLVWNENLQYMLDWRDANYPNAKLVFLGATPVANTQTTQNARLVELRTLQQSFVTANPNKNLYYFGMDTIVLPNYNPSSTYFSDNVHPTQASQDLYGAGLGTYLKTILP